MKFSVDKNLTFEQAVAIMFDKLGDSKIMALASSVNDYVMVRNVSCLFYDNRVWFKTDNEPLFDWSLESFRGCGWTLADMPEGTPMTDYEARFTEMGLPIHRVVATRP